MHTTGWSRGLEVSGGGQGVVSHAGLALLRHLADKTGLTGGLSRALATPRFLVHDRGRVMADLACAVADGARVISDFRVMSDQRELFGLVASVPTAWRTLAEIARGGARADRRITAAVNTARRHAWAQVTARHGALPGVRLADRTLDGVTCIRLDATVTFAHSGKELAEANFKGYGLLTELPEVSSQFSGHAGLSVGYGPCSWLEMSGMRDVAGLAVPSAGALRETGDPWEPFRLVDPAGVVVAPVAAYLRDLQACGRSAATQRSYGMDLLRWFRFCWAAGLAWDQVTRAEARRLLPVAGSQPGPLARPRRSEAARLQRERAAGGIAGRGDRQAGAGRRTRRRRWRTARRCCGTSTISTSRPGPGRW